MESSQIDISVVIPIYNEEDVLPHLHERTVKVLQQLNISYEIIFVNDGSKDNSLELMKEYNRLNPKIKILSFSRNFGHQTAFTAGLNFSRGKVVIVIDGDLQDPPEIIPRFIEKWKEGYKVVYGIRKKRKEGVIKKSCYRCYYRLLKMVAKIDIPVDSGDCSLMDRKVVNLLNSMPERNRFIRGLRSWVGFKQIGLEYERDKRFAGKTKYTFLKLLKLGLDGIFSFSEVPFKISIISGMLISSFSILYPAILIFNRMFQHGVEIPVWTSIVVSIAFLVGVQLMIMGFLGEYIIRVFDEVKGRPQYILSDIIGFDEEISPQL